MFKNRKMLVGSACLNVALVWVIFAQNVEHTRSLHASSHLRPDGVAARLAESRTLQPAVELRWRTIRSADTIGIFCGEPIRTTFENKFWEAKHPLRLVTRRNSNDIAVQVQVPARRVAD